MQSMRLRRDRNTPLLCGLATDDSHEYHQWSAGKVNSGRGWIMVQAGELSAEALLTAMQAGLFYSTTGVLLESIEKTRDTLRIRIQTEPGVHYRTEFVGTRQAFDAASEPRPDANGNPLPRATGLYSEDVGEVIAESTENPAVYRFTGEELYVRARVLSDKLQENPVEVDDVEMAWVQPVKP